MNLSSQPPPQPLTWIKSVEKSQKGIAELFIYLVSDFSLV